MKNVYTLRLGIVCILLTSTIPASASNYSSPGEAFVVGALSYILFGIIFWLVGLVKKTKNKTNQSSINTCQTPELYNDYHTSSDNAETINSTEDEAVSLSPWEIYRILDPIKAEEIEQIIDEDLNLYTQEDINELVASLERWSSNVNCRISELKQFCINGFVERFTEDELPEILDKLNSKITEEEKSFNISAYNTISFFMKKWLAEYLSLSKSNSSVIEYKLDSELRIKIRMAIQDEIKRIQIKFDSANDPYVGRTFLDVALTKFASNLKVMLDEDQSDIDIRAIIEEEKETALNNAFNEKG